MSENAVKMTNGRLKPKDFASDQEIRWCPGCGDFAILKQVQMVLPQIDVPKENIVFISGIGCSSRFPYYMNTYGMHSIHGRATAVATGLKMTRPELDVWIITGDGDALSIGGNHLMHLLRRNLDVVILLFNNKIYGLTKGQYSPTSEQDKLTKSSPKGSLDFPINPAAIALGSDATFVARTVDREAKHQQEILKQAHDHTGSAFVEIYQNCNIFNDGAFVEYTDRQQKKVNTLYLEEGQPLIFGENNEYGIKLDGYKPVVVEMSENSADDLWKHESTDLVKAQILSRFSDQTLDEKMPHPFGIIYQNPEKPTFEKLVQNQHAEHKTDENAINDLLKGRIYWEVQ